MASNSNQDPSIRRVFLTKQELVVRSGLSAATIQRYKDSRRIPFFQPGGKGRRVLFPLNAIEAAQRELTTEPSSPPHSEGPADTAGRNPPKLPGPRPHWQTSPQTKMR